MLRKTRIFVVLFFSIAVVSFLGYNILRASLTDHTIPVITMDSDSITVSVYDGDEAMLEGVSAVDEKDGDITARLFIESKTMFIEKGKFNITIAVADSDNHVVKAEREVLYSNYISPQFSLSTPLKFNSARENRDDLDISSGLSVYDVVDGNISNKIKISTDHTLNAYTSGDYSMEFFVTNSMGDTVRLPVTVTIYSASEEAGLPEIILSRYLVNTPVGTNIDLSSLIEQIKYHNEVYRRGEDNNFYSGEFDAEGNPIMIKSDDIKIDANVNWDVPGVYEVTMSFTDELARRSNYIRCYVVVF